MKSAVVILALGVSCAVAWSQMQQPDATSARSKSGQFVARGPSIRAISPPSTADKNVLVLQPALLVVSCERIRAAVWDALGVSGPWAGRVFIRLRPNANPNDSITVIGNRFSDSWSYQLDMPQFVNRWHFLDAMVQVILLELANRNAGARSAEIPPWLTQGLAQHLVESSSLELMLNPPVLSGGPIPVSPTVVKRKANDPLEKARRTLRSNPQYTLEQLSWPGAEQLSGADGGLYRDNAQVFVAELLRLKDGKSCMTTTLGQLPQCYNWQTAFLRGFKPHFAALLDVEKWWSLQVVYITGRDPTRLWTTDESWRKLDEALQMPAQVRNDARDLPSRAALNLQTVVSDWDFATQKKVLADKVRLLDVLRLRLSPDPAVMAVKYRDTLDRYLKRRQEAAFTLPGGKTLAPTVKGTVREVLKALDELDIRRGEMKSQPGTQTGAN